MKLISLLTLMLFICGVAVTAQPKASTTQSSQDDVREAVFRWQFENNKAGVPRGAAFFCLSLNGRDPTTAFMKRFKGYRTPLKKISQCDISGAGVTSGKSAGGVVFKVEDGMMSDSEAILTGGYFLDGLGASGNQYTVKKINGKWKVVDDQLTFIS